MKTTAPKIISLQTKLPNRKAQKTIKNIVMTLIWPVIALLIAYVLSLASGRQLFATNVSVRTFMRGILMVFIAMWALNSNLNSGRMDFSLGATGVLAALISLKLLGGVVSTTAQLLQFMLLTMGIGVLLGLIGGTLYILLRLPPVVTSLGVALVYEGIAKIIAGDNNRVPFKDPSSLTGTFALNPIVIILLLLLVLTFMSLLIDYSKFGFEKNALVYDQKNAVDSGIKEIKNALICFAVAGALIGLYQFLDSTQLGDVTVKTDLGSSSAAFQNFLPIFIGGLLAKYSNQLIGSLSAVIGTQFLKLGMEKASVLGLSANIQNLINGFMVFFVLIYMVDKDAFINWVKMKRYLYTQKKLGYTNNNMKGDVSK